MSTSLLDDLMAEFSAGGRVPSSGSTSAKTANSANREQPRGSAARVDPRQDPRVLENPSATLAEANADSQTFADIRKPQSVPGSEERRGFSQNSQDSQGLPPTEHSQAVQGCPRETPASAPRLALAPVRTSCTSCQHLGQRGTCLDPVSAGLLTQAEGFGIVWPPSGYAGDCKAFAGKAPTKAAERPHRLTRDQGDAAHAEAWGDAAIALFQARVHRLMRLGTDADDAEDLAERLHLRDVQHDDRQICAECVHYRTGRCGNHRAAGLYTAELAHDLTVMLQRCGGFAASPANALTGLTPANSAKAANREH